MENENFGGGVETYKDDITHLKEHRIVINAQEHEDFRTGKNEWYIRIGCYINGRWINDVEDMSHDQEYLRDREIELFYLGHPMKKIRIRDTGTFINGNEKVYELLYKHPERDKIWEIIAKEGIGVFYDGFTIALK